MHIRLMFRNAKVSLEELRKEVKLDILREKEWIDIQTYILTSTLALARTGWRTYQEYR